jgi:hypothetical protein
MKQQQPLTSKRHKIARDSTPTIILPFIVIAANFLHMTLTIMFYFPIFLAMYIRTGHIHKFVFVVPKGSKNLHP